VTTEIIIRFVSERPFVPFKFFTADGREIIVPHSDFASLEKYATEFTVYDQAGNVEVFDASLIVSIRSIGSLTS
jgi:hypothetical protein